MTPFWLSWWHNRAKDGAFELHSPWWVSGVAQADDGTEIWSVCAAVRAESAIAAQYLIRDAYDVPPAILDWRFVEAQPEDFSPFTDRFERDDWMQW